MKPLALIPARAGSKRLPGKNLELICGQPLIWWTIDVAKRAGLQVAVSTDHPAIAAYADKQGCMAVVRPNELATDDATSLDVVRHAASIYREVADVIVLLQPTSPLRAVEDIHVPLHILESYGADAVVSVVAMDDPDAAFAFGHAGRLHPAIERAAIVRPNGAVYCITMDAVLAGGGFYDGLCYGYLMPPERSLDIDWRSDMEAARVALMAREAGSSV